MLYLHTKNSSYIINIKPYGKLEQVYYGKRIKEDDNISLPSQSNDPPHSVLYQQDCFDTLERISQEYGENGKGDFRESGIFIFTDKSQTTDFCYKSHKFYSGKNPHQTMPTADENCETLEITLFDDHLNLELVLYYHSYYDVDVIARSAKLVNKSQQSVTIDRMMSLCLDLDDDDYNLISFEGSWANEMHKKEQPITTGIYTIDSKVGTSSNRHNPCVILKQSQATEDFGNCYAFNLIYSGNHAEIIERSPFNYIRFLTGINPYGFNFDLVPQQEFHTPEAVMSFSHNGLNGTSKNMHNFINNHIVPKEFAYKDRPILINNWEATYFDFDKPTLLQLAKEAKDTGVELFVLDDGWFGNRSSDKAGLGDWVENKDKLCGTMKELAEDINNIGLSFGLWFEPEMVNQDSQLYKKNPHWVMANGKMSAGRNQFILDLCNSDVRDYIVDSVSTVLKNANIEYVKWDMNRNFSDVFSASVNNQGEVCHRYVMGLYDIYKRLTTQFPKVLFEGCSAGGNRFDLGIMCFMPQIWASDDTDAVERVRIQKSVSYGYPQSVCSAHVSACPNHQTMRTTQIEARFNIAAFGVLGYELDLTKLPQIEKDIVKEQIAFYKENRATLLYGDMYRLQASSEQRTVCAVVSKDLSTGFIGDFYTLQSPNPFKNKIITKYLCDNKYYNISARKQYFIYENEKVVLPTENYCGFGDGLNYKGFVLNNQHIGKLAENTRTLCDFGSRLYNLDGAEK